VYYLQQEGYVFAFVSVRQVGFVTGNSRLDFVGYLYHDVDTGIFPFREWSMLKCSDSGFSSHIGGFQSSSASVFSSKASQNVW